MYIYNNINSRHQVIKNQHNSITFILNIK